MRPSLGVKSRHLPRGSSAVLASYDLSQSGVGEFPLCGQRINCGSFNIIILLASSYTLGAASPSQETVMRTFAEFQILDRVGKVKEVGKTVRITIAAEYGR